MVCAATTRNVAVRAGYALRGREYLEKGRDKRHTRMVGTGSSSLGPTPHCLHGGGGTAK